jgi:hypothetical protein
MDMILFIVSKIKYLTRVVLVLITNYIKDVRKYFVIQRSLKITYIKMSYLIKDVNNSIQELLEQRKFFKSLYSIIR